MTVTTGLKKKKQLNEVIFFSQIQKAVTLISAAD